MATLSRKTVRSVALPAEHGGWSFWLEPVLLAMLVAASDTGVALVVLSLASFLMRQPLKIALIDLRKKKLYLRTRLGIGFVTIYGIIAFLAFLAALSGGGLLIILPLIPAYDVALIQVWLFDIRGNSRHWIPEVIGAFVMSAFAVSIALAGGWSIKFALALAVIISARGVPTIFYVRARLRQIKSGNVTTNAQTAFILHGLAVIVVIVLRLLDLAPTLTIIAMLILLGRAIFFIKQNHEVPAKVVGMQEIVFGLILVISTAIGYIYAI